MTVEVRTYKTKHGLRDRFLDFFEHEAVPLRHSLGIRIVGFHRHGESRCVRLAPTFPSEKERDRLKTDLYGGEKWRRELEAIAMHMLDRYDLVLANVPDVSSTTFRQLTTGSAGNERR